MPKEPIVLETTQNHATITDNGICPTLTANMGMGGGYVPMVIVELKSHLDNFKADGTVGGGIAFAIVGDHESRPTDMTNLVVYETDNIDRKKVL